MELPRPLINIDPRPPEAAEAIASLPETRGVYLFTIPGNSPHLGWSLNLRRRLTRLLPPSYTEKESGIGKYFQKVTNVACWPAGSRLEASLLMYQITREHFPNDYLKRLRLRMPWYVVLDGADAFPRLDTVQKPGRRHRVAYGPFFSRDLAQRYEQEVLGLFQIRRCAEKLTPSPEHPGCIYGEMSQCMRPCQCAVSADEYANEVLRLDEFLATNGKTTAAGLATARERAAGEMDFEQAAQLHKRFEKVSAAAASRDAVIAPLDQFNGLALTRGSGKNECRLFPIRGGYWQKPVSLHFSTMEPGVRSLDQELRETLASALAPESVRVGNRVEQLALFARWYYSSWRDGQWFPFVKLEDLPYRRLVREISLLLTKERE